MFKTMQDRLLVIPAQQTFFFRFLKIYFIFIFFFQFFCPARFFPDFFPEFFFRIFFSQNFYFPKSPPPRNYVISCTYTPKLADNKSCILFVLIGSQKLRVLMCITTFSMPASSQCKCTLDMAPHSRIKNSCVKSSVTLNVVACPLTV